MTCIPLHILGSCASRDALELPHADKFQLIDYVARTSLASLACGARVDKPILEAMKSSFQRRMVEYDMKKQFWKRLATYESGVLLIDLVDDRFGLRLFDDGTAHTVSAEYAKTKAWWSSERSVTVNNRDPKFKNLWAEGLRRLNDCLGVNQNLKVFVNCVYFTPTAHSEVDRRQCIARMNEYLTSRYATLRETFGEDAMIEYPDGVLRTDPHHKWGPAPFHFAEVTYQHMIDQIYKRF